MNFRPRRTEEPEINLIPFIDVLLVILIFVMLTSTFSRFTELQVTLPNAQAEPPPQAPTQILLAIAADGRVSVDRQPVDGRDVQALTIALGNAAQAHPGAVLVISADAMASHQSVVTALDAARRAGLARLTFAAQRNPAASP